MAYTEKFQSMADLAIARVEAIAANQVDALVAEGAMFISGGCLAYKALKEGS